MKLPKYVAAIRIVGGDGEGAVAEVFNQKIDGRKAEDRAAFHEGHSQVHERFGVWGTAAEYVNGRKLPCGRLGFCLGCQQLTNHSERNRFYVFCSDECRLTYSKRKRAAQRRAERTANRKPPSANTATKRREVLLHTIAKSGLTLPSGL